MPSPDNVPGSQLENILAGFKQTIGGQKSSCIFNSNKFSVCCRYTISFFPDENISSTGSFCCRHIFRREISLYLLFFFLQLTRFFQLFKLLCLQIFHFLLLAGLVFFKLSPVICLDKTITSKDLKYFDIGVDAISFFCKRYLCLQTFVY